MKLSLLLICVLPLACSGQYFNGWIKENSLLSAAVHNELCSSEALAKMSPLCRFVCQLACGLYKVAQGRSRPYHGYGYNKWGSGGYNSGYDSYGDSYYGRTGTDDKDKASPPDYQTVNENGNENGGN